MCRETDLSLRDCSSKNQQQEIEELTELSFFDKLTVEQKDFYSEILVWTAAIPVLHYGK